MAKLWKGSKRHCFEMFMRGQVVNMKIVTKHSRNSSETLCTQSLVIFKKFSVLAQILSFL